MTYETTITIACILAAMITITISFRLAYWRNRADRAEAALARVETVIANEHRSLRRAGDALAQRLTDMQDATLAKQVTA